VCVCARARACMHVWASVCVCLRVCMRACVGGWLRGGRVHVGKVGYVVVGYPWIG